LVDFFGGTEFVTYNSDTLSYHHYLFQPGMQLNLHMGRCGVAYSSKITLPLPGLDTDSLSY
jgi:hypothetical protein